jgi:hypothetical protein
VLASVAAVQSVEDLKAVEAVRLFESTRYWMYVAVNDNKTCEECDNYAGSIFNTHECHFYFSYLEEFDDELWLPMVHPHCRCMLVVKAQEYDPFNFGATLNPAEESTLHEASSMHDDYERIRKAFMKMYGPQQGGKQFKAWLKKNGFDPDKSYGVHKKL